MVDSKGGWLTALGMESVFYGFKTQNLNRMNKVTELYRELNQDGIPEIQNDEGEIAFTPDQMIWFGNEVVKNCSIPNVRQQSKLLNAFLEWRLTKPHSDFQTKEHDIKEFLEAFNCA
jgi:hypothetical protein